ncbi:MAG: hypothetical protein SPL08_01320 [Pseudomonadota bacterium]|nr:hypothetical protein [Pseudomonadota bacterium]
MLNDNEILYIVPFTNVKVEKTALNKDFGGWSILTGEQLLKLYDDCRNVSLENEGTYFVKKCIKDDTIKYVIQEENLLIALLRSLNYCELDISQVILVGNKGSKSLEYIPYNRKNIDVANSKTYFYPIKTKMKVLTTSLLKKIDSIIVSGKQIPVSFYKLLSKWNQSFDANSPWDKTKLLYPIWDKLILSVKNKTAYDTDELLKELIGVYPDKYAEIENFLGKIYKENKLPFSPDYIHLARKMKFGKKGQGASSELFPLFLGKHVIPVIQRIIWHSLLNLATKGCVYPRYIKTEYDIQNITD